MKQNLLRNAHPTCIACMLAVVALLPIIVFGALSWWRSKPTSHTVVARLEELDPQTYKKICAHRVNNIFRYRLALQHFNCLEIDVHVSPAAGGPPAVYHPPAENNHGLTLDFLLTQEGLPEGTLWLDTKDLSSENWKPYLDQLDRLVPIDRRGDVIVETPWSDADVQAVAAAFRQSGFEFSYYLPTEQAAACGRGRTATCDALRRQVVATISRGFSHLSFDSDGYEFAKSIRGDLPPAMRFLTWDLTKAWPRRDLLDDVDIYIIHLPSEYEN